MTACHARGLAHATCYYFLKTNVAITKLLKICQILFILKTTNLSQYIDYIFVKLKVTLNISMFDDVTNRKCSVTMCDKLAEKICTFKISNMTIAYMHAMVPQINFSELYYLFRYTI